MKKGIINHSGLPRELQESFLKAAEQVYGIPFKTRRRSKRWFLRLIRNLNNQ